MAVESSKEEPSTVESSTIESSKEESSKAAAAEIVGPDKYINLTMLTPRDGLPDTAPSITGLRSDSSLPFVERTQRSERTNKFQASVFGNSGLWVLIPVGVLIFIGAAYVIFKRFYEKKTSEKPKKMNKSDKPDNSKKNSNTNKSNTSKKSKKKR